MGVFAALSLAVPAVAGCGGHAMDPKSAHDADNVKPADVAEPAFTTALHDVLHDTPSENAALGAVALRLGVVKQTLAHASGRFARGDDARGLDTVFGALYLLRPGDRANALVDTTTVGAIDGALRRVSARGDATMARFFYELSRDARRSGVVPGSPSDVESHLANLEAFERETRRGSPIELLGLEERAAVTRVLLTPSNDNLDAARGIVSSWIDLGIQHNVAFKQTGKRPTQGEAIESTRAMESGPQILVALHLRAGDLEGAVQAIDGSSARRVIDPGFYRAIRGAADRGDAMAWRTAFSNLDEFAVERGGDIGIEEPLLGAALFNAVIEAYRRDPADLATTLELSRSLSRMGMGEAVPLVLADGLADGARPEDAAVALRLFAASLELDRQAGDDAACARAIAASEPLLTRASAALRDEPSVRPRVSDLRLQFAEVQVHAGQLGQAKDTLAAVVAETPSSENLLMLALVTRQLGDAKGALAFVAQAASAAGADPLDVAAAETLGFELHRAEGHADDAAKSLERALRAALDARRNATKPSTYRVKVERTMGRILEAYGENSAAGRAFERALDQGSGDRGLVGATLVRSMGFCLLIGDVERARATLERGAAAGASVDDMVYAALWLTLLEEQAGVATDGSAARVFEKAANGKGWVSSLASWGLRKLADGELVSAAPTEANRVEASFYVAMRARAKTKDGALDALAAVAKSGVLNLVEVDVARELTAPSLRVALPKGIRLP